MPFIKVRSFSGGSRRCARGGLHHAHADSAPRHSARARRTRHHRQRPDRHRQDRRVCPAHSHETGPARARSARAHSRTDARTRRAGGNRHPRFRALHQFESHRRLWRRRLRPADGRFARGHGRRSPPRRAVCSIISNAARCGWTRSSFSCSTRPTGCWTWDFCPTCAASSNAARASATPRCFPPPFRRKSKRSSNGRCNNPETIEIGARRTPAETVKHVIYPVSDSQKSDLLLELLKRVNYNSVLIFCRTKHGADRVAGLLKRNNHAVAVLHSNRTQKRTRAGAAGLPLRQVRGARGHGHRRARAGHRGREPRHQLRRAAASGGLHPPHRAHGPRGSTAATPSPS